MTKAVYLILLGCLLLISCVPAQTPLPAILIPTIAPAVTLTPTQILIPTKAITLIPSATVTARPTATPTLSPDQYPPLAGVALSVSDLDDHYFSGTFGVEQKPVIKDISNGLDSQFDCSIDCHRDLWSAPGVSVTITMVRTKTKDDAVASSKDLCFRLAKTAYTKSFLSRITGVVIKGFDDCAGALGEIGSPSKSNPYLSLSTWVLPESIHEISLASTRGTVFFSIRLYIQRPGDDFGGFYFPVLDFAARQVEKLKEAGYSE